MTQTRALRRYEEGREWQLIFGEALKVLWGMPPASVDLCLTDVPFGTTNCAWDAVIPFAEMWRALRRVMKPGGATLLYSTQPFTTALVGSNLAEYQVTWYWMKNRPTNFVNARYTPMKAVEEINVFNGSQAYFPLGLKRISKKRRNVGTPGGEGVHRSENSKLVDGTEYVQEFTGYPTNVLTFPLRNNERGIHPNRKPAALNAYLIQTYSKKGDLVLDFTCGSGSTGEAALPVGRRWVGIEKDAGIAQTALSRVAAVAEACRAPREGARVA